MRHAFTDDQWEDYLAGRCALHSRARIDAHLLKCEQCWELYQKDSPMMRALAEAAMDARERLTLSDRRLQSMLAVTIAGIGMIEDDSILTVQIRSNLEFLRKILVSVFGPKAAQCALILAANESGSRSPERMTRESWNRFLDRLADMTAIICGDILAGVIREYGQLASAEVGGY